jgi:hypothetical protein
MNSVFLLTLVARLASPPGNWAEIGRAHDRGDKIRIRATLAMMSITTMNAPYQEEMAIK